MSYARSELLRALRNRRFFIFSVAFPLILFWVIAGPNSGPIEGSGGIQIETYYMVTMAAYGGMIAVMSAGVRIAAERDSGWTRQLRLSPLRISTYFRTKVLIAYLTAGGTIVLLYASGLLAGVRIDAIPWLEMTGLIALGLVPFAALGILLGHLFTQETMGPIMGGGAGLLALIGGFWFPITSGFLYDFGQLLPSWWLVQADRVALGADAWPTKGWLVVGAWTVLLSVAAVRAYRRDQARG
jgi:ABC-2 type transport system permease protein